MPRHRLEVRPKAALNTPESWAREIQRIRELDTYKDVEDDWRALNVCILSVSPFESQAQSVREFSKLGFLKDVESTIKFVFNGDFLDSQFKSVLNPQLSIPVSLVHELSKDPRKHLILVAGGRSYTQRESKEEAIRNVLVRRLANVLVTDEETATRLLMGSTEMS